MSGKEVSSTTACKGALIVEAFPTTANQEALAQAGGFCGTCDLCRKQAALKTPDGRILALARSFPCLASARLPVEKVGVLPAEDNSNELRDARIWLDRLHRWTRSAAPSSAGEHAADFVLMVWSGAGRFDLRLALACWDDQHRAAFTAWVAQGCWLL